MDNFNNKFSVLRFYKDNKDEFQYYKGKAPREFYILEIQDFYCEKNIFILLKKSIFHRKKIVGYAIIYDCTKLNIEDKNKIALIGGIDSNIIYQNELILISDFMISKYHRRKGIGTEFFRYIGKRWNKYRSVTPSHT